MKPEALRPGAVAFDAAGTPCSPDFDDVYHPPGGALAQARDVFLNGTGLPAAWHGRARHTVLETGFGLGHNFLATWQAWRDDAGRCERLHYIGIEKHPVTQDALRAVHASTRSQTRQPLKPLADELAAAWPALTRNLHTLSFDGGRVQLLLAFLDVREVLPELVAQVDAFYLDGFAPAKNPAMWEPRVCKALARIASPAARLATWNTTPALRDSLAAAGFEVHAPQPAEGTRGLTVARYAPAFVPRRAPSRSTSTGATHVVIIGAGLAGCATAWALSRQGVTSTLIDRLDQPAGATSGNAAGLFHGIVTAQDGTHARFNRAAALTIERVVRAAIATHGIPGAVDGVLRFGAEPADALQATLDRLALPSRYVQALAPDAADALAGLRLQRDACFYPGGGWADPAALCAAYLAEAGARVLWRGGLHIERLRRTDAGWQLLDLHGNVVEAAEHVVLACAADALRLLAPHGSGDWPLHRSRGQTTVLPSNTPGLVAPKLPLTGDGYIVPARDGRVWCGASSATADDEPALRASDQAMNIERLGRLLNTRLETSALPLAGRVGWRFVADDRLPMIGAVPLPAVVQRLSQDASKDAANGARKDTSTDAARHISAAPFDSEPRGAPARLDQPRFVPRLPGLYLHTALASRGITWSALGAETLAALIAGSPCPIEASLLDAVDAARFVSRSARRAAGKIDPSIANEAPT